MSKTTEQLVGILLTGGQVDVSAETLGEILCQLRRMAPDPLVSIAEDTFSTPSTLRSLELGAGKHYVNLPLLFRYVERLGLTIKLEKAQLEENEN